MIALQRFALKRFHTFFTQIFFSEFKMMKDVIDMKFKSNFDFDSKIRRY